MVAGTVISLILIVAASIKILGRNNQVEKAIDRTLDTMVEIELKLPPDSVHIDLGALYNGVDNS